VASRPTISPYATTSSDDHGKVVGSVIPVSLSIRYRAVRTNRYLRPLSLQMRSPGTTGRHG
jgi:hypothetical protein